MSLVSRSIGTHIDLNKNEIRKAAIENLSSDPSSPATGQAYFNTTTNKLRVYNGTSWTELSSGSAYLTWNNVTGTSQSASVNNAYVADNASLVTVTLPSTAAIGDRIMVIGAGAGGWKLAQNASQLIKFNNGSATTTGTGGYLQSNQITDVVEIICIVANTTWLVVNSTWAVSTDAGAYTNPSLIVDKYTGNGTWTKRAGLTWVRALLWPSGGGAGAGRKGVAGSSRSGGGGGAGGPRLIIDFDPTRLGSTESVTVGAAPNGGAAQTTNSVDGNAGTGGNYSQFSSARTGTANAGVGGSTSNIGGGAANTAYLEYVASTTGASGANGQTTAGGNAAVTTGRPSGGGGGGGITSGGAVSAGGNGGAIVAPAGITTELSAAGGGATNTNGTNGSDMGGDMSTSGGAGGGGGGASSSGNAGDGGNGGIPGGGGGGGGAGTDSAANSGKGGNGARGEVWVINWF